MKKYSNNAYECTVYNLFVQLDKKDFEVYDILVNRMKDVSEKDKGYFINALNLINRMTHERFLTIPIEIRKYYSEYFSDVLREKYNKIMSNITNKQFKSFSDNLFNCYIKTYVTKNYDEITLSENSMSEYDIIGWYKGLPITRK